MADNIKVSDDINLIIQSLNRILISLREATTNYNEAMTLLTDSSNGYLGETNPNINEFIDKSGKRMDSLLSGYQAAQILARATLIEMAKTDDNIAKKIYTGEYDGIF